MSIVDANKDTSKWFFSESSLGRTIPTNEKMKAAKSDKQKASELHDLLISHKRRIFYWVLRFSFYYLVGVFVILLLCMFKNNSILKNDGLSDAVIIALLTSTTTTIIALPTLITYSLFPKDLTAKNQKIKNHHKIKCLT